MRIFLAGILLVLCLPSRAATFSDLWWNPNESGWGVNMIEQAGVLFVTLFVYGPDTRPTWYVGPATTLSGTTFIGPLYETQGPFFAGFFSPAAVGIRQVGAVSFTPSSKVRGTLSYSVNGVSVTKSIQRQSWRHINLSGVYYGAVDILNNSACGVSPDLTQPNFAIHTLTATVSQSGNTGTLTMSIGDSSGSFTFTGTYTQFGSLYEVNGSVNFGGTLFPGAIRDFAVDDDGIRGNLLMLVQNGTCTVNFRFSAVRPG